MQIFNKFGRAGDPVHQVRITQQESVLGLLVPLSQGSGIEKGDGATEAGPFKLQPEFIDAGRVDLITAVYRADGHGLQHLVDILPWLHPAGINHPVHAVDRLAGHGFIGGFLDLVQHGKQQGMQPGPWILGCEVGFHLPGDANHAVGHSNTDGFNNTKNIGPGGAP